MRALRILSIVLAMSFATVAAAEDFDGSVPLDCKAEKGHDCLPTANKCSRIKPESDEPPVFRIDAAKKEAKSPFRNASIPIASSSTNDESLLLMGGGGEMGVVWSARINRKTGAFTITTADRKGAYILFGQCKVATAAPAP